MAKKQQGLTAEERLEQALVPESEQPYEVPGNWVWTMLGTLTIVIGGGTPSSNVDEYYVNGSIPWISPVDLSGYIDIYISHGKKFITELGLKKSSAKLIPQNSVLLSSRAPIGYIAIAENELCTNQGFKSFLPSPSYLPKYLYFYLKYSKELLESYASGTTFLELSGSKAAQIEFPLPPLAEQQRIVDRIESLFAKLDQAKGLIQEALDSFENRKAAILHQAFSGELTKKWREENGVGMESWEEKPLSKLCSKITDGEHFRPPVVDWGIPFLSAKDIRDDCVSFENVLYISKETAEKALMRCSPEKGDVLIVSRGATVGRMCVVETDDVFCLLGSVILLKVQNMQSKLVCYFMKSPKINQQLKESSGATAQQAIYLRDIKEIMLPVPSDQEQQEIVRILDEVFAREQQAQELYDSIESINLMKKAILARAFRGELGTNDPQEESALELLKDVLAQ
jgi:type I restriction enzyme S subunit